MQAKNINFLLGNHVDGLIITPTMSDYKKLIELKENKFPVVQVDEFIDKLNIDYVVTDNYKGSGEAVTYLIGKGHRKIAYLAGPNKLWSCKERLKGYKDTLKINGIPPKEESILFTNASFNDGYEKTKKLLQCTEKPEVIYTVNGTVAAGAIRALVDAGLEIPKDIAIMGFDDLKISNLFSKPLTTMHQKKYQMGKLAAKILIDKINDMNYPVQNIVFEPKIIIRESC